MINKRETILKLKLTDFSDIEKIFKQWQPYNRVWQLSKDFTFKIPNFLDGREDYYFSSVVDDPFLLVSSDRSSRQGRSDEQHSGQLERVKQDGEGRV